MVHLLSKCYKKKCLQNNLWGDIFISERFMSYQISFSVAMCLLANSKTSFVPSDKQEKYDRIQFCLYLGQPYIRRSVNHAGLAYRWYQNRLCTAEKLGKSADWPRRFPLIATRCRFHTSQDVSSYTPSM